MIDPKILRDLLDLLGRPEIPINVRTSIATELGQHHYLPAKELLIAGLHDPDSNMRSACITALSIDMQLKEVAPHLVEILLEDEFENVRIDAAYGLGALRYKTALPSLKLVIQDESLDMSLRGSAFKAVLSILGREQDDPPELWGKPVDIDW